MGSNVYLSLLYELCESKILLDFICEHLRTTQSARTGELRSYMEMGNCGRIRICTLDYMLGVVLRFSLWSIID